MNPISILILGSAAVLFSVATSSEPTTADTSNTPCCAEQTADAKTVSTASAGKALDWAKKLEGTWVAADENGEPTDTVMTTYSITAGGNAVLEVLFPGTDHEMISLYYLDGEQLMMSHFC